MIGVDTGCRPEVMELRFLEAQQLFGDHLAAAQDGDVLHHGRAAVAQSGALAAATLHFGALTL